tara:strand:+ start:3373 stop:3984 length:612 start_codon:yes stop_codon:yes gene_type:complete
MGLKTKRLVKYLVMMGCGCLCILILFLSQIIFFESHTQSPPDYVVILGGGGGVRVQYFAEKVYQKYPTVPVLLTGGILNYGKPGAYHMAKYAKTFGVKAPMIKIDTSKSTLDDALHSKKYFMENNIEPESLLVITSDFHSGRARWTFNRVFPDVDIYINAAPHKLTNKWWWTDYNMAQHVLEEKARFLFYRLVVFLNPSILNV